MGPDRAQLQQWVRAQFTPQQVAYRIHFGTTGFTYETIFGEHLIGADEIVVEAPYLRAHHQILNFLRFCETAIRIHRPKKIQLVTRFDNDLALRPCLETTVDIFQPKREAPGI